MLVLAQYDLEFNSNLNRFLMTGFKKKINRNEGVFMLIFVNTKDGLHI